MRIKIPKAKLAEFSKTWKVRSLALFGSALDGDFKEQSDVDLLISFIDEADWTLFDVAEMEIQLTEIFQRKVDLVLRSGLEQSTNALRRNRILNSAKVIYDSAA